MKLQNGVKKLYQAPDDKKKISLRGQYPGSVPKFRLPVQTLISKDAIDKKTDTPMKTAFECLLSMQKDVHFQ